MEDIANKIQLDQSRADERGMIALRRLQDDQRYAFLDKLHVAVQAAKIRITDWEQHFVSDLVSEQRQLTGPQRTAIDNLRHRYQHRL
jgi:hypothetical protein